MQNKENKDKSIEQPQDKKKRNSLFELLCSFDGFYLFFFFTSVAFFKTYFEFCY